MALSGTIQKVFSTGYTLRTRWSATQNVSGNYSTITCIHELVCARSYDLYVNSKSHSCVVGGVSKTFKTAISTAGGETVSLGTTTHQISHNADGTKTASISTTLNLGGTIAGTYISSVTASGNITLDTIPRASGVTCNSFYIGDSTTINISRASSSFTHTIKYVYGTVSGTIVERTSETSIGWTPPAYFYDQIPYGRTGYGSVICETYNGTTLIGTTTANFNAYAKESDCIPDVSATIIDTNTNTIALTGDNTKLIKYLSKPKVTVSATAKNSTSIKTRTISWSGETSVTASEYTFSNGVTSSSVSISATDNRDFSKSVTYDLTNKWVEYVKLAFSSISISRPESTSSTAKIKVSGNYFNGSFGTVSNDFTLQYRYKVEGGSYGDYITVTPNRTNDTFDYSETISDIDYQQEYVFEFVVEDKAMIVSSGERKLEKGEAVFRIGKDYIKTNGKILDNYGTEVLNGISKYRTGGVDIDPNTTLEELILTETNTPTGGFWYVRTLFYSTKTATSSRTQIAYSYASDYQTPRAGIYTRSYISSTGWSEWKGLGIAETPEENVGNSLQGELSIEWGKVVITPVANTPTTQVVYFNKTYVRPPIVLVSASTGVIGTGVLGVAVAGIATNYATLVMTRINNVPTGIHFAVIGKVV